MDELHRQEPFATARIATVFCIATPIDWRTPMKTLAIALFATIAFAGNVFAAPPEELHNVACTSSAFTPMGVWDCQ
jgi:hypothetical protein